jgi:hypothetical protein
LLPDLRNEHLIDMVVANGENSAGGIGIVKKSADEIFAAGVDVITLGNHAFDKKEFADIIDHPMVVRPANYPEMVPGRGFCVLGNVAVVNLLGRFNMPPVDCPFAAADRVLKELDASASHPKIIIVDFHAELTSEKEAMGYYLDGKVSAVIGTHTHVPTADERILPCGTGYVTDAGMVGSTDSVIGVEKAAVIKRFLTGMPARFEVAKNNVAMNAIMLDIDDRTGRCLKIERLKR